MTLLNQIAGRGALALLLLALACGDDDDKKDTSDAAQPATGDDAAVPGATEDAGGSTGGGNLDASVLLDASRGLDATPSGSGGDAASDAAAPGDAAQPLDGALADAGCSVQDPRFGCGQVRGTLVEFASGYAVDRAAGLVWAPLVPMQSDNDHSEGCGDATFTGVGEFALPSVDQVRSLAAGCEASCQLASRTCVGTACNEACAPCAAGAGPHPNGGYCRPELAECSPIFTRDACDVGPRADCDQHQHWYYDPTTGVFRLVSAGMKVAGRCAARISPQQLP